MEKLNQKWNSILGDIPSPDEVLSHLYETVAGDRMVKYGEFPLVDGIAKAYGYTHDQVFNLSWREAYTIHALNREQNYIEIKAGEMKSEHEKSL